MKLFRLAALLAAPLLLASCLLSPGKFVSSLDIRKDRSFTFAYQGEILLLDPSEGIQDGMSKARGAFFSSAGWAWLISVASPAAVSSSTGSSALESLDSPSALLIPS